MFYTLLIAIISAIEYIGDSNFKVYARDPENYASLWIGIAAYVVMVKFLIDALRQGNVMYTNAMWDGMSALLETALAFFILKETLSHPVQWLGLFMIIGGLFALHADKVPY
jgi:multidrug transporter EmrE-like cation transporter